MLRDPLTDGDMPINIRISEQAIGQRQQQEIDAGCDQPGHGGAPGDGMRGRGGLGGLLGHAGTLRWTPLMFGETPGSSSFVGERKFGTDGLFRCRKATLCLGGTGRRMGPGASLMQVIADVGKTQ